MPDLPPALAGLPPDQPVLIAGPTASGKSELALRLAERDGGVIVNADASQVYDCWRVVTARPSPADEARAPHRLFGHVSCADHYSTGHWLRDVAPLLDAGPRPIVVGGTGLYFAALTEGLADIPPVPAALRAEAAELTLDRLRAEIDAATAARIDLANRARVQRAWEVLRATGRGLADWQDATPPPLLPLSRAAAVALEAPRDWLAPRIARRFDAMLEGGAIEEVAAMLDAFDPDRPAFRAIGVPEIAAHLRGEIDLDETRRRGIIATRRFAKRQRTWMRARMRQWRWVAADREAAGL